ncbi:MAG: hypothetical protein R3E96_00565 [Planctomycetota bacterium]
MLHRFAGPLRPLVTASGTSLLLFACAGSGDSHPALVVDAGSDQTALEREVVTLQSTVTQNVGVLTYLWSQVSGPAVTLSDPAAPSPTFTLGELGFAQTRDLVFQLQVGDGPGRTGVDQVTVHAEAADRLYFGAGPIMTS